MSIRRRRSISEIIDDYFDYLERWVEQFEETVQRPSWNVRNCAIEPLREMMVTPTEVIATVDLPFTTKDTVQVKPVDESYLEIMAEMNRKIRLDQFGMTHCKGEFRKYHCSMHIPVPVKMDKMKIGYKKGILEIHLPRRR